VLLLDFNSSVVSSILVLPMSKCRAGSIDCLGKGQINVCLYWIALRYTACKSFEDSEGLKDFNGVLTLKWRLLDENWRLILGMVSFSTLLPISWVLAALSC